VDVDDELFFLDRGLERATAGSARVRLGRLSRGRLVDLRRRLRERIEVRDVRTVERVDGSVLVEVDDRLDAPYGQAARRLFELHVDRLVLRVAHRLDDAIRLLRV